MNTIKITGNAFIIPGTKIQLKDVESGNWYLYTDEKSEMYLHERLGLEAATSLCLWEDRGLLKVTKNEYDHVVGIARKVNG